MKSIYVKNIYIYPIKSLGGIELTGSPVERRGLKYDRRWMLVDENGRFVSQREHQQLALLQPRIENHSMVIEDRSGKLQPLSIDLEAPIADPIEVTVWDDSCQALPSPEPINQWFSSVLGFATRLVYMPESSLRIADQRYAPATDDHVSFADGYPILIIGQASLNLLNQKLGYELPMNRFRPNLVLEGLAPHEEDTLAEIMINRLTYRGVKPCARCVMTTIDQNTGEKGAEPLRTLAGYRKSGNKILFGENFIPEHSGEVSVGLRVETIHRKDPAI
ncbi:MOSC domain-containing protein [Roseivirga thermotolerans]|uniref:MOSC domain-containing protein n=1 Tax=Roseivirga thermotolerans TaxID=1758176 RepID=UPI00273D0AC0|nr:MOSC N-terminal beta barrel domain-containing protein [Roseivirga thermotolerans]